MRGRRLVGIDLGIASSHTVRVLDGTGETLAKRKCWPTLESLTEMETVALAGAPGGTHLEVVNRAGVAAGRGVLRLEGAPGFPGQLAEGIGPAEVLLQAHEDERDRRGHAWRSWTGRGWSSCTCPTLPGPPWTGGCGPRTG
jgi:hypothetical protein